jgi:hypothetical protein
MNCFVVILVLYLLINSLDVDEAFQSIARRSHQPIRYQHTNLIHSSHIQSTYLMSSALNTMASSSLDRIESTAPGAINTHVSNKLERLLGAGSLILPLFLTTILMKKHFHPIVVAPFLFLLAYAPCLVWGFPKATIGSWKSATSNFHRFGGMSTLLLPLAATIWEGLTSRHIGISAYASIVSVILMNIVFGCALIPKRIPAYDVPTTRAFAVGVLLGFSFLTLSLFFRFGHLPAYRLPGTIFAIVAVYTNIYAWSDSLQHLKLYFQGHFKSDIGRKWYLPFEKSSYKQIFVDALIKQPRAEGLAASVSPSNIVTVSTTFLTAIFALICLLQVRYLWLGMDGMIRMKEQYPNIVQWSTYEALLAVVANNFGTFAGTLVLHNKVTQRNAGVYNAVGLMIPVMNLLGFCTRNPKAMAALLATSTTMF